MASTERLRFCETDRDEEVLVVRLCRPELGNALHRAANDELAGIFNAFFANPALGAAVVTGRGSAFSVGSEVAGEPLPGAGFGGLTSRERNPKPIVAAVNGDALDEGFELALACDLVVAVESAAFGLGGARTAPRAPADRYPHVFRQVPLKRAMAALLTGKSISAPEGVLFGFVNELANPDDLLALATSLARRTLPNPAGARGTGKPAATGAP